MSEFEWLDIPQLPISDEEYAKLTISEVIEREQILAASLGLYINRFVDIKNSSIIKSTATLREMMERGPAGMVQFISPKEQGASFLSSQIAA